jgi:hypothetical protein
VQCSSSRYKFSRVKAAFKNRLKEGTALRHKFTVKPEPDTFPAFSSPPSLSAALSRLQHLAMASRGLKNTALFICDIQERFRGLIHEYPHLIKYSAPLAFAYLLRIADKMLQASKILKVPVYATEQNVCQPLSSLYIPRFWHSPVLTMSSPRHLAGRSRSSTFPTPPSRRLGNPNFPCVSATSRHNFLSLATLRS